MTTSGGNDPSTWSAGDWFGVASYGAWPQAAGVPIGLADDSAVGISGSAPFASDTQGIIDGTTLATDRFFASIDTVNGANTGGSATATWEFDIAGFTDLELTIDMAAMGDFENADSYVWSYSIDGGAFQTVFASTTNEAGTQSYTMQGGAVVSLDDPLQIQGTSLNDVFQPFTVSIQGTGSVLTLQIVGTSDGGSEAFAARNIIITGNSDGVDPTGPAPEPTTSPTAAPTLELTPIYDIQGA